MNASHYHAARAATILTDLGTAEAVGGLRAILSGRHSAVVRAVGAGLLRSKNRIACELARPLLESPYEELYADGALVLGSFGDEAARRRLEEFTAGSGRHPAPLVALSCWYLLKISHQTEAAGRQLARQIERR